MGVIAKHAQLHSVQKMESAHQLINHLDLGPIKVKIMDKEEGLDWTRKQADEVEKFYKRFLFLNFKYPEKSIVPNKQVDAFWHFHILDTMKYAEDCSTIFGYFLHHFPYFGMRGEKDAHNLQNAFSGTCTLFEQEFGEPLGSLAQFFKKASVASVCASPNCYGSGCVGSKCGSEPDDSSLSASTNIKRDLSRPSLAC